MSNLLGPIRQLGIVVDDIEAGMKHWSEVMGVGPWFYNPQVPIVDYTYDGQSYEPHNSVALANSGEMQVELIQTRNDVPSMYRDFMLKGLRGLQHVAFWTTQFDDDLTMMEARGFTVKMSGTVGENGRFVYFAQEHHPGTCIELSEVMGPKGRMFDMIRGAAVDWDGADPVRPFPDLAAI
ncbi:VOC family protein [Sedimentitalea sp. JM2-8]|uniref:VOC family protein n=1 Tax=Sedimentitalea xiamensis TaxID=3050037 RepID=A0ABT7FHC0_9RHOB|nr:VOC family protein [Sedimentitalea xiamensis]MDK3074445.1 VOC family protein [Sedimentitalea xiamensis]